MNKNFLKPLLAVAVAGFLSVSLSGCQTHVALSSEKPQSPNYPQIVSEYQEFFGKNGVEALASKRELNKNLQGVLPSNLVPVPVWNYLDEHLISPNMVEEIWPSVLAVKKATAKYPAFSDTNIQKIIDEQRRMQKLPPVNYDSNSLAFFRMLLLQNVAQQSGLPTAEMEGIIQLIQKSQSKAVKFGIGTKDEEISTLIAQATQNGFHTPVMKPTVAQGVILQGYSESAREILSRVSGGQK